MSADTFAAVGAELDAAATTALAERLTEALGLGAIGVKVTGAHVFGSGVLARVDVHLSNGKRLRFDRFDALLNPKVLAAALVSTVGIFRTFKGHEAGTVGELVFALAQHHDEAGEDGAAVEWGTEFLRIAPTIEVAMDDQADRWRGFSALARTQPSRDAGEDRSAYALAAAAGVLVDTESRARYVRSGWFAQYVRREAGAVYSPATLSTLMQRVGWQRPNSQGRINATSPDVDRRPLSFRFYVVVAGWELPEVIAPARAHSRAHARAKKEHVVTPEPEPDGYADPDAAGYQAVAP